MNKEAIYIDAEDDITAIISKVKQSKERVVALVPPKRTGVLQSAVNLRLLARAAEAADKRLVLVTASPQLQALAGAAGIPVAKNLQSKPEIVAAATGDSDPDEDIIDGAQLPIGELARTADTAAPAAPTAAKTVKNIKITDGTTIRTSATAAPTAAKPAKQPKVPDFGRFRKRLLIFGGLGVLLAAFLVWAIWFAPRATIVVMARTSESPVTTRANLSSGQATDFDTQTLQAVVQETSADTNVEFEATGTEVRGEKATGTMTLTRSLGGSVQVPAGTSFSSGDYTFVSLESVVVPKADLAPGTTEIVPGTAEVAVEAVDIGSEYNLPAQSYQAGVEGISARGSQMTGGSKQTVKIVTAADMQTAREKLVQQNTDAVKAQLKEKFDRDVKVIDDSFVVTPEEPRASVDVGEEAPDGKATLTSLVHYRLSGVAIAELDKFIRQAIESRLANPDEQRVYDSGAGAAELSDFQTGPAGDSVSLKATGQVGPRIDENAIKTGSRGQRYGDVQSRLEAISGVSSVDVQFWPFWVQTVPDDTARITVEFKLQKDDS